MSQVARHVLYLQCSTYDAARFLLYYNGTASTWRYHMSRIRRADVAESLRDQIVTGLHVGRLTGGDRLPPTRA